MEFVSFPSLKETGKGVFEYVRQDFSCKGKIYLYPITDTTGVAFCGEPSRSDLIIPVVIRRLLNKNIPFAFFFTVDQPEGGKKLFGAVIYDGKALEPYLVPYDSKAVKSVLYYALKKKETTQTLNFLYLGAEDFEHFLKSLISVNVEFKRIKPKPVSDEELTHLISEPSIVEFIKEITGKLTIYSKTAILFFKEKILPYAVILSMGIAGFYAYKWFKHSTVHKRKTIPISKKGKRPVFPVVKRNQVAFKVIKNLSKGDGCIIVYDSQKVTGKGSCNWENVKGGKVTSYVNGIPIEVVYPIKPNGQIGKLNPIPWEKAVSSLKITGNYDTFISRVSSLDELTPLFETNKRFTVTVINTGKEYLVEVHSGNSKGKVVRKIRR